MTTSTMYVIATIGAVIVIALVIWFIVACCAGRGGGCGRPAATGTRYCRICQQTPCTCANASLIISGAINCASCGCNPCRCAAASSSLCNILQNRIALVAGAVSLFTPYDFTSAQPFMLPIVDFGINTATTVMTTSSHISFVAFARGKSKFVRAIRDTDSTYSAIQVRASPKSCVCGGNGNTLSCNNCNGGAVTYRVAATIVVIRFTTNLVAYIDSTTGLLLLQPPTLVGQVLFTPTSTGVAQVVSGLGFGNPLPIPLDPYNDWYSQAFAQRATLLPINFTTRESGIFSVRLAVVTDDETEPTLSSQIVQPSVLTVEVSAKQFPAAPRCCKCFQLACNGSCGSGPCGFCNNSSCTGCRGSGCCWTCGAWPCICNGNNNNNVNVTICTVCQQAGCNGGCRGSSTLL